MGVTTRKELKKKTNILLETMYKLQSGQGRMGGNDSIRDTRERLRKSGGRKRNRDAKVKASDRRGRQAKKTPHACNGDPEHRQNDRTQLTLKTIQENVPEIKVDLKLYWRGPRCICDHHQPALRHRSIKRLDSKDKHQKGILKPWASNQNDRVAQ